MTGGTGGPAAARSAALCLPPADAERLAAEASRWGIDVAARCTSAAELAALIPALRPDLVVTVAQPPYLDARLLAVCDAHGVRLLVGAAAREEYRHARSLGIAQTVAAPVQWPRPDPAVRPATGGRRPDAAAVPSPRPRGRVLAVWGPEGAPGRTSLAIALAAELARRGGAVALADADTHAAAIAPALGVLDEAPGFAAACRLAGLGALSREELERVAEWIPLGSGGFSALTGIGRASRWPELTAERVGGVIEAARDWVGRLVVDTAASIEQDEELMSDLAAPRRNAAALAALHAADEVLLVGAADPVGLARLIRAHAELLELVDPARITVLVNKVRSSAVGIAPEAQLRQSLARFGGIRAPVLVPWDPAAFDAALLSARPLGEAAPRSPAVAAIRALVADRLARGEPSLRPRGTARRRRRLA